MAESMKGLKRTHRCAEVICSQCRRESYHYGMGTEEAVIRAVWYS